MSPNAFTMPRLLAFSAPAIPLALLLIPLTTLLPTYYSQTTGLDLKSIGLIFLVARLFDGIIDPVIGVLSDRTPPEFGRRRSWMIAGALLAAFGCWLVFFPAKTPSAISLTLALAVLYTGWTMIAVPFFSWTAELSRSYSERSRIAGIRDACYFFGVILGAILIGVLTQAQNGLDPRILTVFGIVSIVTLPALVTLAIFVMPEARHNQHEPQSFAADLKEAFSVLADNPPLRRLLTIFGFAQMAAAISNTLSFLYVQKFQDAPQSVGLVVLVYFAATVAGLPLWVQLSYRVTKHFACATACIVLIVASLIIFFIPPGSLNLFLAVVAVAGFANGGALSLPNAMTADVVDYDNLINGRDRAGLFFSLKLLTVKLANALAVGIAFPLLGAVGFDASGRNSEQALFMLRLLYCGLPVPLLAISIALLWNFPLDPRRVTIINRRLQSRRVGATTGAAPDAA